MQILRDVDALPTWGQQEVFSLLDEIAEVVPAVQLDWDARAGVEWARVLGEGVECLIRAPTSVGRAHRFAFLRSAGTMVDALRPLLDRAQVTVVELADFEEPKLSIRIEDLARFVDAPLPPPHVFDSQRFAANDLVFVSE
jgi:hypothetical protein